MVPEKREGACILLNIAAVIAERVGCGLSLNYWKIDDKLGTWIVNKAIGLLASIVGERSEEPIDHDSVGSHQLQTEFL